MSNKKQLNEIAETLEKVQILLQHSKGKTIIIKEYLTTDGIGYDRHHTSCSHFKLLFETCGTRISGARFWIEGIDENNGQLFDETTGIRVVSPSSFYEIDIWHLREIFLDENRITFIEALSDKWVRKTEIIICII